MGQVKPKAAVRFLRQFYEPIYSWTVVDITACACNFVSLCGKTKPLAIKWRLQLWMILLMQLLVVTFALVVA